MSAVLEDTITTPDSAPVSAVGASVVDVPTPEQLAENQTPVTPDEPRDESQRLNPEPTGPITLMSGQQVDVVPLKLRETMKLLKIVTRGAGAVLEQLMGELDLNDPQAFAQTLGALILMSIPEAENEAIEFIQSMVRPAGFETLEAADRVTELNKLIIDLNNPELEDVITIIERVIRRESEDIRNLGKRVSAAFKLGQKVGEIPLAAS